MKPGLIVIKKAGVSELKLFPSYADARAAYKAMSGPKELFRLRPVKRDKGRSVPTAPSQPKIKPKKSN